MDKASVLGDAIKYVKQLQARVITLEDQSTKKTVESTVLVRRSKLFLDEEDENLEKRGLPEIEAKLCDKNVLVRIHCEKRKGVLARILGELEKLHLSVINSSALPFADSALDITVTAQVKLQIPDKDAICVYFMKNMTENLVFAGGGRVLRYG